LFDLIQYDPTVLKQCRLALDAVTENKHFGCCLSGMESFAQFCHSVCNWQFWVVIYIHLLHLRCLGKIFAAILFLTIFL
jgi:hypothetical protein